MGQAPEGGLALRISPVDSSSSSCTASFNSSDLLIILSDNVDSLFILSEFVLGAQASVRAVSQTPQKTPSRGTG